MGIRTRMLQVSGENVADFTYDQLRTMLHSRESERDGSLIDIDKSINGIIWILELAGATGNINPLSEIIKNFPPQLNVNEQVPMLHFDKKAVAIVNDILRNVDTGGFERLYDPQRLNDLDIYPFSPAQWDNEQLSYLIHHFKVLKSFFEIASENGRSVISYTC